MVLSIKLWLPVNSPDLLARWRSQSFGEGAKQVKVSVVEELCLPLSLETPWWCNGVYNFCLWLSRCNETRCPIVHSKPLSRQGFEQLFLNWSFNFSRGILAYLDYLSWDLKGCFTDVAFEVDGRQLWPGGRILGVKFLSLSCEGSAKTSNNHFQGGHSEGASCQVEQNNAELRAALDQGGITGDGIWKVKEGTKKSWWDADVWYDLIPEGHFRRWHLQFMGKTCVAVMHIGIWCTLWLKVFPRSIKLIQSCHELIREENTTKTWQSTLLKADLDHQSEYDTGWLDETGRLTGYHYFIDHVASPEA